MLRYLFLSIGQLGDHAVLRALGKSLVVTLGIFLIGTYATYRVLHKVFYDWRGQSVMALAVAFTAVVALVSLWVLFRGIAIAVIGLFADDIVVAVERRHYPQMLATARSVPFVRAATMSAGAAIRVGLVNLILLPVYVALLVTGIGTAAAFLLVNGWLLGRDLTDMVAARHLDRAAMRTWRRGNGGRRFLLGLTDAVLFLIPGVNILAPVLGAAMATHMFHDRRA